jgi:hypothetical protein
MTWPFEKPRKSRKRLLVPLALIGLGAMAVQMRRRRHQGEHLA